MVDIQAELDGFIPQVVGKYINVDWEPESQGYGAQCWDLAAYWSTYLGLPVINTGGPGRWPGWAGNMVDAFPQTPAIAAAYTLIPPDQLGQGGDIVVFGDGNPTWYPKTHVAVLVRDLRETGWVTCVSQNSVPGTADNPYPQWSTGPTTLQNLSRGGLIGFIRPNVGSVTVQGQIAEEDMGFVDGISDETADKIADHLLNRDYTTSEGKPAKLLWLLQSMPAILDAQARKTAAATAQLILNTEVPDVMTGGTTTLGRQVSWMPEDFRRIREGVTDEAVPDGLTREEFGQMLAEELAKAADGLTLKVSAEVKAQ